MQHTEKYGYFSLHGWRRRLMRWANLMPTHYLGRRLALILRKIVIKSLPKGQECIDAEIEGLKMRVYLKDNVSERKFLFMPQFFDTYERNFIRQYLGRDGVFIDIGANAGIYSLTAAKTICDGKGKVYAVEPHPIMQERLKYNISINGFENKIKLLSCAVADKSGTMPLIIDDSNLGGNSLTQKRGNRHIDVECTTLIELINRENIKKIDIMKIDIEGAEDKALVPFVEKAPVSLYPKYIIMEDSKDKWEDNLETTLLDAGYVISHISRMNCVWSYDI